MDVNKIKLIALDLDGTLTQHREQLGEKNREVLNKLAEKYKLIMVGAGKAKRIFSQMGEYPIDIIGNYGLQYATYNQETKSLDIKRDEHFSVKREEIEEKVNFLRGKHGFTSYRGENVEYHDSGCVTIPLLGTKAIQADKLAFDPDRKKRRAFYGEVVSLFEDYNVFVGGSSSFDMSPKPYNKYYALDLYCRENGISHSEVVFIGDDYGEGGNDESVYKSDFNYLKIDNYLDFDKVTTELL
jgi:HAD superfamily hydrolase (TIGR01484 family)